MKPYTAVLHTILIILLALFCAYLTYRLSNVQDSLSGVVSVMNPEEGIKNNLTHSEKSYDLSTIFTFMGVIFGLFSFLTFQSIKDFYASKIKEVEDKYEKTKDEYIKQKHKLIELENNISYQMSELVFERAEKLKIGSDDKKEDSDDINKYVIQIITGCEHLSKSLVNPINENELFINHSKSKISDYLQLVVLKIGKKDYIAYNNITPERLKLKHERISRILTDAESCRLLNEIFGKIKVI